MGRSVIADAAKATARLSVTWPIPRPPAWVRKTFSTYIVTISQWKITPFSNWPLWSWVGNSVRVVSSCTMGKFQGRIRTQFPRNLVIAYKNVIAPPKQSHSAIRHNIHPVSRATLQVALNLCFKARLNARSLTREGLFIFMQMKLIFTRVVNLASF